MSEQDDEEDQEAEEEAEIDQEDASSEYEYVIDGGIDNPNQQVYLDT